MNRLLLVLFCNSAPVQRGKKHYAVTLSSYSCNHSQQGDSSYCSYSWLPGLLLFCRSDLWTVDPKPATDWDTSPFHEQSFFFSLPCEKRGSVVRMLLSVLWECLCHSWRPFFYTACSVYFSQFQQLSELVELFSCCPTVRPVLPAVTWLPTFPKISTIFCLHHSFFPTLSSSLYI